MRHIRTILLFICSLLLSSCTTVDSVQKNSVTHYSIDLKHFTNDFTNYYPLQKNKNMYLYFPAIYGAFLGTPSRDVVQEVLVLTQNRFTLSLSNNFDDRATVISNNALTVKPSNTKVIRLGTFSVYEGVSGGGAFRNKETGDFLALIYFSEAATINGQTLNYGQDYLYNNLSVNEGWNWMSFEEYEKDKFNVSIYKDKHEKIEFIAVMDIQEA